MCAAVVEHRSSWRSIWQGSWDWELISAYGDDGTRQTRMVLCCALHMNWLALATSYDDEHGEIEIWDLNIYTIARRMGDDYVSCLAWLGPGLLAAAGRQGVTRVWDLDFAEEVIMYTMHYEPRSMSSLKNCPHFAIAGIHQVSVASVPEEMFPPAYTHLKDDIRKRRPDDEEPPVPIEKEVSVLKVQNLNDKELNCEICFVSKLRLVVIVPTTWELSVFEYTDENSWQERHTKSLHAIHAIQDAFATGYLRSQPRLHLLKEDTVLVHGGNCLEILDVQTLASKAIFGEYELLREREVRDDPRLTFCSVTLGDQISPFDDIAHSDRIFFPRDTHDSYSKTTLFAIVGNAVHRTYETTTVRSVYTFSLDEPKESAQFFVSRRVHKQLRQAQLQKERKAAKQLARQQRLLHIIEDEELDHDDLVLTHRQQRQDNEEETDDYDSGDEDYDSDDENEDQSEEMDTTEDHTHREQIYTEGERMASSQSHALPHQESTAEIEQAKNDQVESEASSEHSEQSVQSEEEDLLLQCARVLIKRRRSLRHIFFRRTNAVRRRPGQAQLIAMDDSGLLWQTTTKFNTSWPGPHFPLGFELVEDNTVYQERENEFDFMHGQLCVPAEAHDLVAIDGYFGPSHDEYKVSEKVDIQHPDILIDILTPPYPLAPNSIIPRLPSLSSDRRRRAKQASLIHTFRDLFGVSQALFAQHDPLIDDPDDDDMDDRRFFTSLDDDILLSSEDEEDEKSASDDDQSLAPPGTIANNQMVPSGVEQVAPTAAETTNEVEPDDDDDDEDDDDEAGDSE